MKEKEMLVKEDVIDILEKYKADREKKGFPYSVSIVGLCIEMIKAMPCEAHNTSK